LIIPAAPAAAAKAMTSVPDMLAGSLAEQMCNSSPQVRGQNFVAAGLDVFYSKSLSN